MISISASEVDEENTDSFLSNLIFWKSDNSDIKFNLVMSVDKDGTLIEVQDNNYLSYTNIASEEIMRALYSDFR